MAKQSGLHQLRGKVGEHSYYKQTGVASGLVRSINQGMSARVKTSEEYANVRLNNAEFGQAGRIAKVLGQLITPKFRPMLLPFSQSKMCKVLLDAIKSDTTASWGRRNLSTTSAGITACINALNLVRKNDPDSYGISLSTNEDKLVVTFNESISAAKLAAIGADGFNTRVIAAGPWIGSYGPAGYGDSYARFNFYDSEGINPGDSNEYDYLFPSIPPVGWPAFRLTFGLVIVFPYRTINGTDHILQEHCTYMAFDTPEE